MASVPLYEMSSGNVYSTLFLHNFRIGDHPPTIGLTP